MKKTNYHTHSTFCDGHNTPEEMVISAIEKKFDILGFSGHCMYPFASEWHTSYENYPAYIKEIARLKEKYSQKLTIYTGFEYDYFAPICCPKFSNIKQFIPDFLLGAVHYVPMKDGFYTADDNYETVRKFLTENNISSKDAVIQYFECQREMLKKGNFTFLAHCDLIRKQNSKKNPFGPLFSEEESWYKEQIELTVKEIKRSGVCVEINTGGIARGYMESPYPSPYFLSLLYKAGIPVTINSDSHAVDTLDAWFPEAIEYIKKAGYKEVSFFESGHLISQKL